MATSSPGALYCSNFCLILQRYSSDSVLGIAEN